MQKDDDDDDTLNNDTVIEDDLYQHVSGYIKHILE